MKGGNNVLRIKTNELQKRKDKNMLNTHTKHQWIKTQVNQDTTDLSITPTL